MFNTVPSTVTSTSDISYSISTQCRNGLHMKGVLNVLLRHHFQIESKRQAWTQVPQRHYATEQLKLQET